MVRYDTDTGVFAYPGNRLPIWLGRGQLRVVRFPADPSAAPEYPRGSSSDMQPREAIVPCFLAHVCVQKSGSAAGWDDTGSSWFE